MSGQINVHSELHPCRRRGAPVSRDEALQLAEIRRILAAMNFVAEPISAMASLEPTASAALPINRQQLFEAGDLEDRLLWAQRLAGDTKTVILQHLVRARELGCMRRVAGPPEAEAVGELERDFPHCSAATGLLRRRIALGNCCPEPALKLPPLLLSGKPGSGKTAFAKRVAAMLRVPCHEVDMASLHSSFSMVGLDAGYATGRPGAIWDALQAECMSPVVILDELDKTGVDDIADDPTGFLYSVLEPLSARRFVDAAIGLPIDASRVSWIGTCNDHRRIHPAILSRFLLIEIDYPTTNQMHAVVASIHREMMARSEWAPWFEPDLAREVVDALAMLAPREVMQTLEDAYASAASAGRRRVLPIDVHQVRRRVPVRNPIGFLHGSANSGSPQ